MGVHKLRDVKRERANRREHRNALKQQRVKVEASAVRRCARVGQKLNVPLSIQNAVLKARVRDAEKGIKDVLDGLAVVHRLVQRSDSIVGTPKAVLLDVLYRVRQGKGRPLDYVRL
jgi:hypothetical protein